MILTVGLTFRRTTFKVLRATSPQISESAPVVDQVEMIMLAGGRWRRFGCVWGVSREE